LDLSIKGKILRPLKLTLTLTLYASQTVLCEFMSYKETLSVTDILKASCYIAFQC